MTKKEAIQILAILKAAYPASYQSMTKEEASGTVGVWCMQFADMPVDIVMMAVQKLISTCKFPPSIAEVKDKIKTIHWEASDMLSGRGFGIQLPEEQRAQYQRIYELTDEYRYGKMYEPGIELMLGSRKQLELGE